MPKETFRAIDGTPGLEVQWRKHDGVITIGVYPDDELEIDGEFYDSVWVDLVDEEVIDRLIAVLLRAKRKAFN